MSLQAKPIVLGVTVLVLANVFGHVEEVSCVELNTRLVSQHREDDASARVRHSAIHKDTYTSVHINSLFSFKLYLAAIRDPVGPLRQKLWSNPPPSTSLMTSASCREERRSNTVPSTLAIAPDHEYENRNFTRKRHRSSTDSRKSKRTGRNEIGVDWSVLISEDRHIMTVNVARSLAAQVKVRM